MENPIKMDDLGVPLFFGNTQFSWMRTTFGPIIFVCGNFSIPVTWMNWVYPLEGRPTPSWPKFAMIHRRKSRFLIFHQELPPWKLPCPVKRCNFYLEISSSNHQFSGGMLLFRGGIAKWFGYCKMITFSKTNIWPWKWMVGRLLSFGRAYFRGYVKLQGCRVPFQGYAHCVTSWRYEDIARQPEAQRWWNVWTVWIYVERRAKNTESFKDFDHGWCWKRPNRVLQWLLHARKTWHERLYLQVWWYMMKSQHSAIRYDQNDSLFHQVSMLVVFDTDILPLKRKKISGSNEWWRGWFLLADKMIFVYLV